MGGDGAFVGWYFTQGKKQSGYIRDSLDNTYIRKGWVRPVLIRHRLDGGLHCRN